MPRYETQTSQVGVSAGSRQTTSDLILLAEPRARFALEARKGRLYVLLETDAEIRSAQQACQLVARTLRTTFYSSDSYSVTSSLREALYTANKALYKQNFNTSKDRRVHVGLTCAILKDHDLFLAQIAPAQAYVLTNQQLRAMPMPPNWNAAHMSATPFLTTNALGASLSVEPELYRCQFNFHDSFLLCSSNLAQHLSKATVDLILSQPNPHAASEELYTFGSEHDLADMHAIVVKLITSSTRTASHDQQQHRPLRSYGLGNVSAWFANLTGQARVAPDAPDVPLTRPDEADNYEHDEAIRRPPPAQPIRPTSFPPQPLPIDTGETLEERHQAAHAAQVSPLPPSSFLGEGSFDHATPAPQEPIDLGDDDPLLTNRQPYRPRYERRPLVDMTLGEKLAAPFRWLSRHLDQSTHRRAASSPLAPHLPSSAVKAISSPRKRKRPPFPWVWFTMLTLIIAVLILYGITLSRRNTDERTIAYLDEAETRMAAVLAAPNAEAAVPLLDDAEQALEEVRASPQITETNVAFWLRYQDLQNEYESALASVHQISYLDEITVVAEHPRPTGRFASVVVPPAAATFTATHSIEAQASVYALDANSDAAPLYRIPRQGGTPQRILGPEDVVRSTVVGPIRAQAWRLDSIVAIDRAANGYGYFFPEGDGWNHIRLGGSEIWTPRARIDLETYQGNLYVWGAEPNEILKFTSGRYGDIPELWLNPPGLGGRDLGTSIDMAIDGYIYLLQPDGRIYQLNQGNFEREIVPEGIEPPISAVTRFFVTGELDRGWIFLLDTLNERVIQIEKNGRMVQQMRLRPTSDLRLNQLTDMYIDSSLSRPVIYLVNGGQILQFALPTPPTPFSELSEIEPTPTSDSPSESD
jgi:serine/threonine protein phosphatase PrpC